MRLNKKLLLPSLAAGLALSLAGCGGDGGEGGEGGGFTSACQFGEVFTTDGRIEALNLELVEDPGVFILYNVSFTWQDEVYQENAATYDSITETLLSPLDEEKMAELNGLVDVQGQPAAKVAEDYLAEVGLDSGNGELDGVSLAVGSKDFTENILLGEMYSQALENAGAQVDNQVNLGGTSVAREALLAGEIDVYPEYNGTGWTVHLGNEDPSQDPQELYQMTADQDLQDNGIQWVGRSPFNDTYGFAANGDLAQEAGPFDLQGMADYLEQTPDATVCMETEFPNRPDGLILFEEATGYEVPKSQIETLETGLIYTQTAGS